MQWVLKRLQALPTNFLAKAESHDLLVYPETEVISLLPYTYTGGGA